MPAIHIGHHFYGAGNLGDDLMLQGFLDACAERSGALTCCSPFDLDSQRLRFPEVDWRSYDDATRERSVRECDVWLGLGDTPFQNDTGPWLLQHLAEERAWCRRYGKPMFFLGVGVGNRSALDDPRARAVLFAAEHIWARDEQSAAWLAEVCGSRKVSCAADLAHLHLRRVPVRPVGSGTLAFVLHFENVKMFSQAALTEVLKRTAAARHHWLVQEVRPLTGSERTLLAGFPPTLASRFEVHIPDYARMSLEEMRHCWPVPETLVSTRYHASVICAWAGSQVLIVERSDKLAGLAAQLNLRSVSSFTDAERLLMALSETKPVSRSVLERLATRAEESCREFLQRIGEGTTSLDAPKRTEASTLSTTDRRGDHNSNQRSQAMGTQLVAERIERAGRTPVPLDEVLDRLDKGDIIVLRGCLQALDCLEDVRSKIGAVLREVVGVDRAEQVMTQGLEWIHRVLDGKELAEFTRRFQDALERFGLVMVKRVARELLGVTGDSFVEESRNVRIFVPQDAWVNGRDAFLQFEKERSRGKLTLHGPHTDLWFYHPWNVINVWTAIGPVLAGNGMTFWPELFGERPPLGCGDRVRDDQVLGQGLNFHLDAGDALLFHIGHLHGSEINQTEQTRFVLSGRFTTGPMQMFDKPWHSYLHLDEVPEMVGKRAAPHVSAAGRPATPANTIDTSSRLPAPVASQPGTNPGTLAFDVDALPVGEIRPLNEDYCVARTAEGIYAFSRYCPHEGADLAAGHMQDGQVRCPRHNLTIDPRTGESPCLSLPVLHTLRCSTAGPSVTVTLPPPETVVPMKCPSAKPSVPSHQEELEDLHNQLRMKEAVLQELATAARERLEAMHQLTAEIARLQALQQPPPPHRPNMARRFLKPWKLVARGVRRLFS